MTLPAPGPTYSQNNEAQTRTQIDKALSALGATPAGATAGKLWLISDFGRVGTGDDTATFNAAAAAGASGDAVYVPPLPGGASYNVGHITLPNRACLFGAPRRTTLKAIAATNAPMFQTDAAATFVRLSGMVLLGNKSAQSAGSQYDYTNPSGTYQHGILINGTFTTGLISPNSPIGSVDPTHCFADLVIWNFNGAGIRHLGRGASFFRDIRIFECDGVGLDLSTFDNHYLAVDIGASGLHGVSLDGNCGNNRLVAVKAWYSGERRKIDTWADNFHLSHASRNEFTGCEAQDGYGNSWYMASCTDNIMQIRAESPADRAPGQVGSAGLVLDGLNKNNRIDCIFSNRALAANAAYWLSVTGTNNLDNVITGTITGWTEDQFSGTYANNIVLVNRNLRSIETPALADGTFSWGLKDGGTSLGFKAWGAASVNPGRLDHYFYATYHLQKYNSGGGTYADAFLTDGVSTLFGQGADGGLKLQIDADAKSYRIGFGTSLTGLPTQFIKFWSSTSAAPGKIDFSTTNGMDFDYYDGAAFQKAVSVGGLVGAAKLGFYGVTPIIKPASANDAVVTITTAGTAGATYTATEQGMINSLSADVTALATLANQLRADLVALGLIKGAA